MPVEKTNCSECGDHKVACPDCGGHKVTPQERHGVTSANDVINFGGEGEYQWKHVCWDCGWTEWVTAEITRE